MKKSMILYTSGLSHDRYNAGSKAVRDAIDIANSIGYGIYYICELPDISTRPIQFLLCIIRNFITAVQCFWGASIVIIQHPILSRTFTFMVGLLKHICGTRIVLLIHDLYSYRKYGILSQEELKIIKNANNVISHSVPMSNLLVSNGIIENRLKNLFVFDYLSATVNTQRRELSKKICFAGNLDKSLFLRNVEDCIHGDMTMYLYGLYSDNIKCSNKIAYKGKFAPNDISQIEGSWGLVWDGTSCSTCEGSYGHYMRINAPHKISLYIAAELPVIIWEEAALATYIKEHKIGLCVSSLYELESRLSKVTEEEYQLLLSNVKCEARRIRQGQRLLDLLKSI